MARRRARRADTSKSPGGPQHFSLQAEYWTRPGDDFAALLPLSADLVTRLNAWNERYEVAQGDLGEQRVEWLDEGVELARLVQLEAENAGENIQVIYLEDRSRNPRHGSPGKHSES